MVEHIGIAHAAQPASADTVAMVTATATRATTALHFLAEAEGLAQAEVGGELVEAGSIIDRNDRLAGERDSGRRCPSAVVTGFTVALVAKAGRSLKTESPFRSWPRVMLKGGAELATTKGKSWNPRGKFQLPPRKRRLRTSYGARP